MHDYDIQTTLNDVNQTFEEFKSTQEERLASLERNRPVDTLVEEKMARLEAGLDHMEKRLKQLSVFENRTPFEMEEASFSSHGQAFSGYIRKGSEAQLQTYEAKSLSTTSEREGGYLVPSSLHERLQTTLQATSVMRELASLRTISTSTLELLIDNNETNAGWVAEAADRAETQTPDLAKIRIPVHEMYAKPRATQRLLDDAMINVEEWLAQKISQKMAGMENKAFIEGDGVNKPKGILAYETVEKNEWEWGKWEEIKAGADGDFQENKGGGYPSGFVLFLETTLPSGSGLADVSVGSGDLEEAQRWGESSFPLGASSCGCASSDSFGISGCDIRRCAESCRWHSLQIDSLRKFQGRISNCGSKRYTGSA